MKGAPRGQPLISGAASGRFVPGMVRRLQAAPIFEFSFGEGVEFVTVVIACIVA
ncbi:MAG TPA: hypothetical protein VMB71_02500 [Acetobacteraceae bacterium]|nr:hypothetical protein [Acetobacteraceae bacterium]